MFGDSNYTGCLAQKASSKVSMSLDYVAQSLAITRRDHGEEARQNTECYKNNQAIHIFTLWGIHYKLSADSVLLVAVSPHCASSARVSHRIAWIGSKGRNMSLVCQFNCGCRTVWQIRPTMRFNYIAGCNPRYSPQWPVFRLYWTRSNALVSAWETDAVLESTSLGMRSHEHCARAIQYFQNIFKSSFET